MRIQWAIFLLIFVAGFILLNGETIENPEKPKNADAGYMLKLKEIQTIDSDGDSFYFKDIDDLQVDDNGDIFIEDEKQLIHLKPNGTFVRNYFKEGQGPGEALDIFTFVIDGDQLVMASSLPTEILIFDIKTGALKKEFMIKNPPFSGSMKLFHVNGNLFFWAEEPKDTKGKLEVTEIDRHIVEADLSGLVLGKRFKLPVQYYMLKAPGSLISLPWVKTLECSLGQGRFLFSHTGDYSIKLVDMNNFNVLRTFSRKYQSVPVTKQTKQYAPCGMETDFMLNGIKYKVPVPKYLPSIQKLICHKDKIWVFTSTVKDGKLLLVDVFDLEGRYVDNFHLRFPKGVSPYGANKWFRCVDKNGIIYATELNEEDNLVIKKYKIEK